jgi:hypothetical protein
VWSAAGRLDRIASTNDSSSSPPCGCMRWR